MLTVGDPYYNWLTQSHHVSSSSSVDTQSSLLFTVGRGASRPPRRGAVKPPPVGPDFGKDRLGGTDAATDQLDSAGLLLIAC